MAVILNCSLRNGVYSHFFYPDAALFPRFDSSLGVQADRRSLRQLRARSSRPLGCKLNFMALRPIYNQVGPPAKTLHHVLRFSVEV